MTPRLLTDKAAAAYLSIPVACVRRMMEGRVQINGRVRWDRVALDRMLDGEPAKAVSVANENLSDADADLAAFIQSRPHAARRP